MAFGDSNYEIPYTSNGIPQTLDQEVQHLML